MVRLSFFAASAFISLAAGQIDSQTPIQPTTAQPALEPPEPGCNGCYVVADIAGVVFGGVTTQTITQITNIVNGPNGTAISTQVTTESAEIITTVSSPVATDQFSFSPSNLINPTFVSTRYDLLDSAVTISGATLTSPTQYELFTAYSITSFSQGADGTCSTVSGVRQEVSPAFSVIVPEDAPGNYLTQAEMQFIQQLAVTCQPGGGNVASILQSMIEQSTTQSLNTNPMTVMPIPANTSPDTPTATPTPTPTTNTTVSTGMPIAPSFTEIIPSIMPGAGSAVAPGVFGVGAAFGIGLAAMFI